MPEWDPDVVVDESLVRALLAEPGSAYIPGERWDKFGLARRSIDWIQ